MVQYGLSTNYCFRGLVVPKSKFLLENMQAMILDLVALGPRCIGNQKDRLFIWYGLSTKSGFERFVVPKV